MHCDNCGQAAKGYGMSTYERSNADWEALRRERWNAVYGAMIAAQVMELRRLRGEAPDDDRMDDFHEEAATVADMDHDAWVRKWGTGS